LPTVGRADDPSLVSNRGARLEAMSEQIRI
jgi:hypothetical protein